MIGVPFICKEDTLTPIRQRKAAALDQAMTAVSIRAPRSYVQALKALAASRGLTIGDLVKDATDAAYGEALQPHIDFFTERERRASQLVRQK